MKGQLIDTVKLEFVQSLARRGKGENGENGSTQHLVRHLAR